MTNEAKRTLQIIAAAIKAGFKVSLFNGEYYSVKRSVNLAEFKAEVQATDEDLIILRDSVTDVIVGKVLLVYGNSVEELVCDYSENPAMVQFMTQIGEA